MITILFKFDNDDHFENSLKEIISMQQRSLKVCRVENNSFRPRNFS